MAKADGNFCVKISTPMIPKALSHWCNNYSESKTRRDFLQNNFENNYRQWGEAAQK